MKLKICKDCEHDEEWHKVIEYRKGKPDIIRLEECVHRYCRCPKFQSTKLAGGEDKKW